MGVWTVSNLLVINTTTTVGINHQSRFDSEGPQIFAWIISGGRIMYVKQEIKLSARIRRFSRTMLGLVAAMTLTATLAQAQYRASIQGVVTDPQGAVVQGASLTLTDVDRNLTWATQSDASGTYTFNALQASTYAITVTASGFSTRTLTGITLIPEQPNTFNVRLEIGNTTESVNVNSGDAPLLDTATASVSGTITNKQIQDLPSYDRDVLTLVALAPGTYGDMSRSNGGNAKNMPGENMAGATAKDAIFKTENNPQVIGNGSQVNANNILVNGVSTSSNSWGGASVITPSPESVDYMKVTSNAYDAEFGRFSGNAIQITSKSGTNTIHGSGFFKRNSPGLNAWTRWNGVNSMDPSNGLDPVKRGLQKNQQRFSQFGGSVGGPLWRNRLFAQFAYEALRNNSILTSAQQLYETSQFLAGAPAGSIAAMFAGVQGEPFGTPKGATFTNASCTVDYGMNDGPYCKTINGMLDIGSPLKTGLGNYDTSYKSKTAPGIGSGLDGVPDLLKASVTRPNTSTASQYYGRIDGDVTERDRLSFFLYYVPLSTDGTSGASRDANFWHHNQVNNAYTAIYNHTFSPTLLNEAHVSASGWRWNEVATNPQAPFGLPIASFSNVGNGTNPQNFGPPNPSIYDQWTLSYQDIVTKIAGRHSLKMGATLWHLEFLNQNIANARPSYTFYSFWDFLNDAPYSESASFNPQTGVPALNRQDERENIFGTFVQDDFKVSPTLTLNLGLRWNYFGPVYNKQNNLTVVVPGSGNAFLTGLQMRKGGQLYTVQKGNFGPQIGFAWNPDYYKQKLVIRGGFGINYNENQFSITVSGNNNVPNLLGFSQNGYSSKNPAIKYAVGGSINSPLSFPSNPSAISTFDANNIPTSANVSVYGFDQHVKTIMVYHYSLDTQLVLPRNFVATLGYQGSRGSHLIYEMNLNAYAAARGLPLNPHITGITYFANGANSNYNAMLASLKHNFTRDFQIEAQYAWSKSMDEGSDPYTQDPYAPISIHQVYGRSDFNVQNMFRVFGMYQPNFFHEKWLHGAVDGWQIAGIYNSHSGYPWTPTFPVTVDGSVGGTAGKLYYAGSPYTSIRPAQYTGGAIRTDTSVFKIGPTNSNKSTVNPNFPKGGAAYFVPPAYTSVLGTTGYSATAVSPAPAPAMGRNYFNGPGYQNFDVSLTKAFALPDAKVIGSGARIEFRADVFNIFNLTELAATPSTGITGTGFGVAGSSLGSRTITLSSRFQF